MRMAVPVIATRSRKDMVIMNGVNVPEEYMILTEEVFEDQAQQHIQS